MIPDLLRTYKFLEKIIIIENFIFFEVRQVLCIAGLGLFKLTFDVNKRPSAAGKF
jgi:hypothetical protein